MRLRSLGQRGSPGLSALAKEYAPAKKSNSAEYRMAEALGRAATKSSKRNKPAASRTAFGLRPKRAKAARLQRLQAAVVSALRQGGDPTALALVPKLVASGANIAQCLTIATAALKQLSKSDAADASAHAMALQAFRDGPGAKALANFRQHFPLLRNVELTPVPSDGRFALFELGAPSPASVSMATAWAQCTRSTNLGKCLEDGWAKMASPITSERGDDGGSSEAKGAPKSPCIMAGLCICQDEGRLLNKFRVRFLQAMKMVFKPATPERQLLVDGKIVCCLRSRRDDGAEDSQSHEVWLHIGYMLFSPYKPTFAHMERVEPLSATAIGGRRVHLKVASEHALMELLCSPLSDKRAIQIPQFDSAR